MKPKSRGLVWISTVAALGAAPIAGCSEDGSTAATSVDASPDVASSADAMNGDDASEDDGGNPDASKSDASVADAGGAGEASDAAMDALDASGDAWVDGGDGGTLLLPRYAVDGTVSAVLHAGSSVVLGGSFSRVSPYPASNLVQIDATGTPTSCPLGLGFDGDVTSILRVGSSIYVGGFFTHYQGLAANRLAKIDATSCALDQSFGASAGSGFDSYVLALAAAGSSLYVGGSFQTYDGASANRIAKLDLVTGALDATFSPSANNGFDNNVDTMAVAGSSLYVGGTFTAYQNVAGSATRLAKLDLTSGALDTAFSPPGANGFDSQPVSMAASATSLYVGGYFSAYRGVAASAAHFAKLDLTTGDIDTTFSPVGTGANGFNDLVQSVALSGSSVYVGGRFATYRGAPCPTSVAKLDATSGALDPTFAAGTGFNRQVLALAVSGTSLIAGGTFSSYGTSPAYAFAKLDLTTGAMDTTFQPAGGDINGFSDGKGGNSSGTYGAQVNGILADGTTVWVGGRFMVYGGYSTHDIAKLDDTTFAVDTTFSPAGANGFDGAVSALASSGSSLYVGGSFTSYRGGPSANRIAKLDLGSGALDTTFSPGGNNGFDGTVNALAVSGTSVYAGGSFTQYRGVASSASSIAKLDLATGALDTTFSPPGAGSNGFDGAVQALAVSATSVYAGGSFGAYRGVAGSASNLAKLDLSSGALDGTFSPVGANGFDAAVSALAISGTSLYAGGSFQSYRGVPSSANRLAKLDLTSGALDPAFDPATDATANGFDAPVLALYATGSSLYVGGSFTTYGASPANAIAKLDLTSGAIDAVFDPATGGNGFDATVAALGGSSSPLVVGGSFTDYRDGAFTTRGLALVDPASGALR